MAHRMRKRFGATPAEALWRDACGGAVRRPMQKHSCAMERALARRLRKRYGATPAEAL